MATEPHLPPAADEPSPLAAPVEAARAVPWNWLDVVVVAVLYVGSGIFGREIVKAILGVSAIDSAELPPTQWMTVLLGSAVGLLVGVALSALWLRRAAQATWADMGLRATPWWADARLGLVGFLALMLPIYGLQFALSYFYERWSGESPPQNPLIDHLREHPDALGFLVAGFIAVIVAPLTEEFVFRAVLQGWLQRVAVQSVNGDLRPAEPPTPGASVAMTAPFVRAVPIVASSLIFALMHYTHGVAWVPLFFFGLGLGYLYQRTQSLVAPVVLHMSLNGCTMILLYAASLGERGA